MFHANGPIVSRAEKRAGSKGEVVREIFAAERLSFLAPITAKGRVSFSCENEALTSDPSTYADFCLEGTTYTWLADTIVASSKVEEATGATLELAEVLEAKQEIFSSLGLTYGQTRTEEPHFSVGISVPEESSRGFRIAIRVHSRDALEQARVQGRLEIFARYPASELDIRITGPIVRSSLGAAIAVDKRLSIGASVGHYLCTAGSLGFFARRTADGVIGMVSNNHVLAAGDEGKDGDDILHPARSDDGDRSRDVVGYLVGGYPLLDVEAPVVDCAFAKLREGIPYDATTITTDLQLKANPAPPELQSAVLKKGRSTGFTRGRISAIDLDHCDIEFDFGIVIFDRQIEVVSTGDQPFARPGDSGSLVVSPDGHPVGLLAGSTIDCRRHYANPIVDVLNVLGVTVLT